MVICGCAVEAQYIKEQKKVEKPKLYDAWEKFLKRQAGKEGNKNGEAKADSV